MVTLPPGRMSIVSLWPLKSSRPISGSPLASSTRILRTFPSHPALASYSLKTTSLPSPSVATSVVCHRKPKAATTARGSVKAPVNPVSMTASTSCSSPRTPFTFNRTRPSSDLTIPVILGFLAVHPDRRSGIWGWRVGLTMQQPDDDSFVLCAAISKRSFPPKASPRLLPERFGCYGLKRQLPGGIRTHGGLTTITAHRTGCVSGRFWAVPGR